MIPRAAFSLHGDTVRYRGEDVAVLLYPRSTTATDAFLGALGCIQDRDTDTLEQDITNLSAEIDFLKLEVTRALKVFDILPTHARAILTGIIADAD